MIKLIKNKIYIMSKKDIENFKFQENKKYLVISISGHDEEPANIKLSKELFTNVIIGRWKFDDIDRVSRYYSLEKKNYIDLIPITKYQTIHIAHFIKINYDEMDYVAVHCNAGISRSAGIVGAISKWLWNDDYDVFNDRYFNPNMYVYNMLLKELMKN